MVCLLVCLYCKYNTRHFLVAYQTPKIILSVNVIEECTSQPRPSTVHSIQYTLNMMKGGKRICNLTVTATCSSLTVDPSLSCLHDLF